MVIANIDTIMFQYNRAQIEVNLAPLILSLVCMQDKREMCLECPISDGFTSSLDGTDCLCAAGRYSLTNKSFSFAGEFFILTMIAFLVECLLHDCAGASSDCRKCNGLKDKISSNDRAINDGTSIDALAACQGGPVGQSFICPLEGLWIHKLSGSDDVMLIPCEGTYQCRSSDSCTDTLTSQQGAQCGLHHRTGSFLCAQCDPGYSKVEGSCVECRGLNWTVLGATVFSSILTGAWLLYKSLKTVIAVAHADAIFNTVDADSSGLLSKEEMQNLWVQLGDANAARDANKRLRKILNNKSPDSDVSEDEEVTRQQFRTWCRNNMPSATMSLAIFAIQTLALLFQDNGLFGWANILNLDAEAATGSCLVPTRLLGLPGKIYTTMLAPGIAFFT